MRFWQNWSNSRRTGVEPAWSVNMYGARFHSGFTCGSVLLCASQLDDTKWSPHWVLEKQTHHKNETRCFPISAYLSCFNVHDASSMHSMLVHISLALNKTRCLFPPIFVWALYKRRDMSLFKSSYLR